MNAFQEGLKKVLNYLPMIYNQQYNSPDPEELVIKYPYDSIPNNALLFVLPLINHAGYIYKRLTIKYAKVSNDGTTINYNENVHTYNIKIEEITGTKRNPLLGDITANRLCMFRFISGNSSDIILCNNPIYNNISSSTLTVTDDVTFYKRPIVIETTNDQEKKLHLAYQRDVDNILYRLELLENKFKIGTDTAEKYFKDNPDTPQGTIYMQMEE